MNSAETKNDPALIAKNTEIGSTASKPAASAQPPIEIAWADA